MKKNYREQFKEIYNKRNELYRQELGLLTELLEELGGSYKWESYDFFNEAPVIQVVEEGCMDEYLTTIYVKQIYVAKMGDFKELRVIGIESEADPENENDEKDFNVNSILNGFDNIADYIELNN